MSAAAYDQPNAFSTAPDERDDRARSRAGESGWSASRARSKSARGRLPWWKRPSPIWLLPGHCLFTACSGAANIVSYEIITRLACRDVGLPSLPLLALEVRSEFTTTWRGLVDAPNLASEDAEWLHRCHLSSDVHKLTTRFVTMNMCVAGILAAATSSYWGGVSDRKGRLPVLGMAALSDIVNSAGQLLVALHPSLGFRTLLLSTAIAASLGGGATALAVTYAYASDCTPSGSRASVFALIDAFLSLGLILGPGLGSLVIRFTGALLTPFYTTIILRSVYLLILAFVIPESLSPIPQREEQERRETLPRPAPGRSRGAGTLFGVDGLVRRVLRAAWGPLAILSHRLPDPSLNESLPLLGPESTSGASVRPGSRNLTWIAVVYLLVSINPAITPVKVLYSRYKFGWLVEQTGYWTSFNSLSKLLVLLVAIPLATSKLRPAPPLPNRLRPLHRTGTSNGEFDGDSDNAELYESRWDAEAAHLKTLADSHWDLNLAVVSIIIGSLGYLIMSVGSITPFLIGTAVAQGSGGVVPAVQSLALTLTPPQDAGRALAALSVLASFSVQVLGPTFYGSIYIGSVDSLPELAFMVAVVWWALALLPAKMI